MNISRNSLIATSSTYSTWRLKILRDIQITEFIRSQGTNKYNRKVEEVKEVLRGGLIIGGIHSRNSMIAISSTYSTWRLKILRGCNYGIAEIREIRSSNKTNKYFA
jgi:hypothetical protein